VYIQKHQLLQLSIALTTILFLLISVEILFRQRKSTSSLITLTTQTKYHHNGLEGNSACDDDLNNATILKTYKSFFLPHGMPLPEFNICAPPIQILNTLAIYLTEALVIVPEAK
jgi:hypothetical protein